MFCKLLQLFFVSVLSVSFYSGPNELDSHLKGVYVNGIQVDGGPVIQKENTTYIPVHRLPSYISLTYQTNPETGWTTLSAPDIEINCQAGNTTAFINNEEKLIPPPLERNGHLYIPIILAQELFAQEHSLLIGNISGIAIYRETPVNIPGTTIQIGSLKAYDKKELSAEAIRSGMEYNLTIPVFYGLADTAFEQELNHYFEQYYLQNTISHLEEQYTYQITENLYYLASEDCYFLIPYTYKNVTSLIMIGYIYEGGAHGMPYRSAYNIDTANGVLLKTADLFEENSQYEAFLLQQINNVLEEEEDLFTYPVASVPEDNFYFTATGITFYYYPYDLAPYSRGFVEVNISYDSLNPYLKEAYSNK